MTDREKLKYTLVEAKMFQYRVVFEYWNTYGGRSKFMLSMEMVNAKVYVNIVKI